MRRTTVLLAGLLAGCAVTAGHPPDSPDPNVPPPAPAARCDATKAQDGIGRRADAALVAAARRASGAAIVRTLAPGTMVTMEYRADRLNVTVDARGVVTAVRCG